MGKKCVRLRTAVFYAVGCFLGKCSLSFSWCLLDFVLFPAPFTASTIYRDREADRKHPVKKDRPLAAGVVGVPAALVFAIVLALAGFTIVLMTAPGAVYFVLLYVATNIAYSLILKRYPIIDVLTISAGFVLRIYAGAAALEITPTVWIQICAGLLALFIALAKRRDDLVKDLGIEHRESLSGYSKPFLDTCVVVTLAVLLVSYLIFTADRGGNGATWQRQAFLDHAVRHRGPVSLSPAHAGLRAFRVTDGLAIQRSLPHGDGGGVGGEVSPT